MKLRAPGDLIYALVNILILFFLLFPLAVVAVFAINPTPYIQFPPVGFSLRWFVKFFTSETFMASLWLSVRVAFATVLLATSIGAGAAVALARGRLPGAGLLVAVFMSPLMLPAILTGLALFQFYILLDLGQPLWGLIAGHVVVCVPYVLRTTLAVLANFDRTIEEAAQSLGASPLRTFMEVTLPLIRPGVIAGAIFAFIISFDQLPVSLFLVSPGSETLPITLLNYLRFELDGTIAAASMVSILLAVLVLVVLEKTLGLQAYVRL
jgi:putative spermidine/putrescine transport system permease protein